jgi:hypothetical protein
MSWSVGHNTAQDQHSKASSSCSVSNRSNREQMQVLGSEVASRKHRKHIVWSIAEISSRPGTCPGRRPSDFAKVSCGGTGRGEQRRVGGQDKHPSMPRAVVASIAQNHLVRPILARSKQRATADLTTRAELAPE